MNKKNILKLFAVLVIIGLIILAYKLNLASYLSIDYLKEQQQNFIQYYENNKLQTISIYMISYILLAALSLPGAATALTVLAGALFGVVLGTVLVSFSSTIGATLAFLTSRFILRESIEKRFSAALRKINEGIKREGPFYLFTLRVIPLFPFFLINLVVGLTRIPVITFFWVSQLGMLSGTAVYVYAGEQLAAIESFTDIASPRLILAFVLIGSIPFILKFSINSYKAYKVYSKFTKPKSFDYNLIVIGAGSAGLVSSYIAATVKAKVALIEKHKMGGDCLNTGCVPSKALINSAKLVSNIAKAQKAGIVGKVSAKPDFKKIMFHVKNAIKKIEPHDSVDRYSKIGVECIKGEATIVSPWEVQVNGKTLTTRNIIVATGARPFMPPLPGLAQVKPLNSDTLWNLQKLPKRLVILGGGPIGCELTQSFSRLGSKVIQIEMLSRIMAVEDEAVSTFITKKFIKEGAEILTEHKALRFEKKSGLKYIIVEHKGKEKKIAFDEVIIAIGRRANITGFGLENLGIRLRPNKTIDANEFLQTNIPNIFVCGDVTGPYQFTHTAAHQAYYASVNALFGGLKKFKVDYSVIPWCTFTDPEVATVGLSQQAAKKLQIEFEVTQYGLDDLDRAITDMNDEGFIQVLTEKGKDKILGATIVGATASTLILEFVSAMKNKFGLNAILSTIHIYPSMGEANKYLAGNWKKAHASAAGLKFAKWFNQRSRKN